MRIAYFYNYCGPVSLATYLNLCGPHYTVSRYLR